MLRLFILYSFVRSQVYYVSIILSPLRNKSKGNFAQKGDVVIDVEFKIKRKIQSKFLFVVLCFSLTLFAMDITLFIIIHIVCNNQKFYIIIIIILFIFHPYFF